MIDKNTIETDPREGIKILRTLIITSKLIDKSKDSFISNPSTVALLLYMKNDRRTPILKCDTDSEIEQGLRRYPFIAKKASEVCYLWEDRIFSNCSDKKGKGVNVWCALSHRYGLSIR